jgi:hypothetical protein
MAMHARGMRDTAPVVHVMHAHRDNRMQHRHRTSSTGTSPDDRLDTGVH